MFRVAEVKGLDAGGGRMFSFNRKYSGRSFNLLEQRLSKEISHAAFIVTVAQARSLRYGPHFSQFALRYRYSRSRLCSTVTFIHIYLVS
jgi:hypothetical protein